MYAPGSNRLEKHLFKDFRLKLPAFTRTILGRFCLVELDLVIYYGTVQR